MKKLLIIIIFIFICLPVFSQVDENDDDDQISIHDDNYIYVINSFLFEIDGNTRQFALIIAGELYTGEQIIGLSKLEEYVQTKTQLLYNQRVLESVAIEYSIGDIREDGKYPVDLTVKIKDTWNIIALPKPNYQSGQGFELTINARDYNFLGTMSPLRINLGYKYDQYNRTFFNIMTDSNTPFILFNFIWRFRFYNYFEYRPDMSKEWYYKNTVGLSFDLPIKDTTLTVGFHESFIYNEANSERNIDIYGIDEIGEIMDGIYMSSRPFISWKIPIIEIGKYGDINYTPNLSATFNHEFAQWPLDITRIGPFLTFNHIISFGRVDWQGNFQHGFTFEALNTFDYNFFNDDITSYIKFTGIGHYNFNNHFSLSGRLMYRHWFDYEFGYEAAADVLRGIWDDDVKADFMVSFNFDLTLGLIRFKPSNWLNTSKLRVFDFDFHINPFLDAAIYRSSENEKNFPGTHFTYKNVLMSTGLEIIVYPAFFRSLFLRASLGINMSTLTGLKSNEIFIGMELHY